LDSGRESEDNEGALTGARGKRQFSHAPVLLNEVIDFLAIQRGGSYIDATVGLAGHSAAIAALLGPEGRLTGFDKDTSALEMARADGLLADLGVSSMQLEMPRADLVFRRKAHWICG
jgi:16S rRNA C1402 N4-methylase RsmH